MSACRVDTNTAQFNRPNLVEEHILAIAALGRKILEITVWANSVLLAQLLPELASN